MTPTDLPRDVLHLAAGLAAHVAPLAGAGGRRRLVALAGPPGSGKSTLGAALVDELVRGGVPAALMPMDGFHLDDRLLTPRGLLPRKGAPETFDFGGLAATLRRVRDEETIYLPVFDRDREIAIAGAAEIGPEARLVVVEGNYLLLDEDPWRQLAPLWDLSVFLDVPMAELERRLVGRWLSHGFDAGAARAKAETNDLPNASRICAAPGRPDLVIRDGRILRPA